MARGSRRTGGFAAAGAVGVPRLTALRRALADPAFVRAQLCQTAIQFTGQVEGGVR